MLIDTHCHLDFPDFAAELDDVVARAHAAGVGALGKQPLGLRLQLRFGEQESQSDAGPLRAAQQAMALLHGGRRVAADVAAVACAFEEVRPGDRREAADLIDGEDHGPLH